MARDADRRREKRERRGRRFPLPALVFFLILAVVVVGLLLGDDDQDARFAEAAAADALPKSLKKVEVEETEPEPRGNDYRSGTPHGDIRIALSDGWDSGVVEIESIEEQRLFTRWMHRIATRGDAAELRLFKESAEGPYRAYRLALGSHDVLGVVAVEKWDGRWRIVGARTMPDPKPKKQTQERPRLY